MTEKRQEDIFSITPGQLLSAARESRGLSQTDISKQTRLSLQIIADIERDEYKRIGARTFTRGYLCLFARLVGIPEKKILESFDASGLMSTVSHSTLPRIEGVPVLDVTRQKQRPKSRSIARLRASRRVIIGASIFLVVGGIAWFQSQKTADLKPIAANAVTQTSSIALAQDTTTDADTSTTQPVVAQQHEKKKVAAVIDTTVVSAAQDATKKKQHAQKSKQGNNNGFVIRPQANLQPTYTITPAT